MCRPELPSTHFEFVLSPSQRPSLAPVGRKKSTHLMASPRISIVVANWEGEAWIARALSSIQTSARAANHAFEVIVVDDASRDGSVELIRRRFPRVRLLQNPRNFGFRRTINRGVRAARGRVVVLCNNDLSVQEAFIGNLVKWFVDPSAGTASPLFAVSARTLGWYDGKPNQVCMGARFRGGRITPAYADPKVPAPCLFAQAGAAAYDREMFLQLGGLSSLYEPGYWEDYDLSLRAARRGWAQLYDPSAIALHIGGGSMQKRFGAGRVAMFKARNHLIFEWRHITSPALAIRHAAQLPISVFREAAAGETTFLHALAGATARLPAIWRARLADRSNSALSDKELLDPWQGFTPSY